MRTEYNKLTAENSKVAGLSATVISTEETDAGTVKVVEADGFGGVNKFEVTVKDGAVVSVKVVELGDTPGISDMVNDESFLSQFAGQSEIAVDAASGATFTSASATKAVLAALAD